MRWRALAGCAALAMSLAAKAQEPPPTADAVAAIMSHALPIEADAAGHYAGEGWRALLAGAAAAQFFMAGEQHGSASIAAFEVALQRELLTTGYTHTAFEIGPASVREVERRERAQPGALAQYLAEEKHGFTVPFLFVRQEMPLLTQAIALSPDSQHAAWGLDQEFVGAAPLLAEVAKRSASTAEQRAAADHFATAALSAPFYLAVGPQEELDAFASAFAGNAEISAMVQEIRQSRAIYAPFMGSGAPIYPANLARETLMKRNFQAQFEEAEQRLGKPPRVFLKFGGSHAMRGHSFTDVPALTNFIAEWGAARDLATVNVLIDCDGGEALDPATAAPAPCEPAAQDATALLAAIRQGPPIQLIDLAALRPTIGKLTGIDPATRRLVLAFDFYVAIRDSKASTPIGAFPKR